MLTLKFWIQFLNKVSLSNSALKYWFMFLSLFCWHGQAQAKMHCGLHITKTETQKVSEEGKDSLSRNFQQELGFSTSLEVLNICDINWFGSILCSLIFLNKISDLFPWILIFSSGSWSVFYHEVKWLWSLCPIVAYVYMYVCNHSFR